MVFVGGLGADCLSESHLAHSVSKHGDYDPSVSESVFFAAMTAGSHTHSLSV